VTTIDLDRPEDGDAIASLSRVLPRVSPSPLVLERILEEAARGGEVIRLRPHRRRRRAGGGAALVVAAAAAAILAVTVDRGGRPAIDREAAVTGIESQVTGDARLVASSSTDGRLLVKLDDMPPAPPGHHYSVWVLRRGTAEMEAVGTFTPSSPSVSLDLPLPGSGDYVAVDVSVEENAGAPGHSGVSIAGATFS